MIRTSTTTKIIRDPIHGEIRIFPLEWLIIDTPLFQRLRYINQLVGSQFVFPGCTHNRFSHSLGAMNICSMYCNKFYEERRIDYFESRILRLSSLLHDIAHGPFSHQFDETIYKKNNYPEGHDDFRNKVIREFLPHFIQKKLKSIKNTKLYKQLEKEKSIFGTDNLLELLCILSEKVLEVYRSKDSYKFAIVQGTLGADRLDFIWRDSYFSGIKGFSKGDIERIISNSYIFENKLVYHIKAIDEIYSSLHGRFMLYKNLYYHKTARAVDLMIQKILNLFSEIIDFSQYLNDPEKFILLTDDFILNLHYSIEKKSKILEDITKIIDNIKTRNLWKMIFQQYIYDNDEPNIDDILAKIQEIPGKKVVDITEELNIYSQKNDILLFDGEKIITLDEFIKQNPIYNIKQTRTRILRIYVEV